jgi:hypothetical protein
MCIENASGNSLRTRKMHSILLKPLCGRRKHVSPIPQQAAPVLSCCRTPVGSASRRGAHVPSSLHSLSASAWTWSMDHQQRQSRSLVQYTKISPSMASESEPYYAYTDCCGLPEDNLLPPVGKYCALLHDKTRSDFLLPYVR